MAGPTALVTFYTVSFPNIELPIDFTALPTLPSSQLPALTKGPESNEPKKPSI